MSANKTRKVLPWLTRRVVFLAGWSLIGFGLTYLALVAPLYTLSQAYQWQLGDVAPIDILAPKDISYISQVRTEAQRELVTQSVAPVYTPTDPSIARKQLDRLRVTLTFINTVRADSLASIEQKLADLSAVEDINIDQETAQTILQLSDIRWQTVQQESIVVLEQVMRSIIRDDRLEEFRRSIPALVSLSIPEDQALLVAKLVAGFITPNSIFSEQLTEEARQKAREAVAPINQVYLAGETVIQRGQVISEADMEALVQLGLMQPRGDWKKYISAFALTFLLAILTFFYVRNTPVLRRDHKALILITTLFVLILLGGRLLVPGHTILPYLYPITTFSLIIATLFGLKPALFFTLPLTILFAYDLPNAYDISLYYFLSSLFGVIVLGPARRVTSFFWAGAAVAVSSATVIIAFRLPQPEADWIGIVTLIGVAFLNGIASAGLAILLQFFLAQFLGLTTAIQLMEISRPDYPLLQFVLRNAPGTYQHSLQVANLAEQAAEQIGADPLLTKVGAIFHDAGKALNPFYFIENQVSNHINPHDNLDPYASAALIIRHVSDGMKLAEKYRLPRRVRDFIAEHHGTMIARYQYGKAVDAMGGDEEKVNIELFRYPGPRPHSRETAILMLADGCEARVRADQPKDEDAIRELIKSVISNRLNSGQLDKTDLTLQDLDKIIITFSTVLQGVYHPRLEYPAFEKTALPAIASDEIIEHSPHPASDSSRKQ